MSLFVASCSTANVKKLKYDNINLYEQALLDIDEGRVNEGLELLERLATPSAYYLIGNYYISNSDNSNAKINYLKAVGIDDSFVLAHNNLSMLFLQSGDIGHAKLHCSSAMASDNNVDFLSVILDTCGRVMTASGNFVEAENLFLKALDNVPIEKESSKGIIYEGLFDLYVKSGDTEKIFEVKKILEEDFEGLN